MERVELIKAWLSFFSSLAWPTALLMIAVVFRAQLRSLIQRVQSGEVAGAKFTFQEVASGFIESKIDELASQNDPSQRTKLAGEIKGAAHALGGIHPIALAILIDGAQAGGQIWIEGSYTGKKEYFDALEKAGLATVHTDHDSRGTFHAQIKPTERGRELLESIGMSLSPEQAKPQ